MSFNRQIEDVELETVKAFQTIINAKTFNKVCRVVDQHALTSTLTFYQDDVFVFAIDITMIDGNWNAAIREVE